MSYISSSLKFYNNKIVVEDTGSNYNVTKTTTFFTTQHREDDLGTGFEYVLGLDLAESTTATLRNILNIAE